ncbi:hypothetical protein D0T49_04470 [Paludibacter sp. 221]|uniref:hypothetical protein n=1 Tax=Paludibacter sp. 221 TaxID=2302939 RepID=UPI0013D55CF2|nr:hypothetical protein [Paludibacter sp. 221]NDV46291.1 hypothetical protein [Paludibacter sp. 221]
MELNKFIKETIVEIFTGIKQSQEEVKEIGGEINPITSVQNGVLVSYPKGIDLSETIISVDKIEFEILLTESDKAGSNTGIGVMLAGIGIGGQSKSDKENIIANKIKFSIPVSFSRQD